MLLCVCWRAGGGKASGSSSSERASERMRTPLFPSPECVHCGACTREGAAGAHCAYPSVWWEALTNTNTNIRYRIVGAYRLMTHVCSQHTHSLRCGGAFPVAPLFISLPCIASPPPLPPHTHTRTHTCRLDGGWHSDLRLRVYVHMHVRACERTCACVHMCARRPACLCVVLVCARRKGGEEGGVGWGWGSMHSRMFHNTT